MDVLYFMKQETSRGKNENFDFNRNFEFLEVQRVLMKNLSI